MAEAVRSEVPTTGKPSSFMTEQIKYALITFAVILVLIIISALPSMKRRNNTLAIPESQIRAEALAARNLSQRAQQNRDPVHALSDAKEAQGKLNTLLEVHERSQLTKILGMDVEELKRSNDTFVEKAMQKAQAHRGHWMNEASN